MVAVVGAAVAVAVRQAAEEALQVAQEALVVLGYPTVSLEFSLGKRLTTALAA